MAKDALTITVSADKRRFQNSSIVLLDDSIDEVKDKDWIHTIAKLREVGVDVQAFTNADQCIDFITNIEEEKVFLICSGEFSQTTVPIIHDISQINTIYILSNKTPQQDQLTNDRSKVKGVFTDITPICQALKTRVQQHEQNLISISFVPLIEGTTESNLDKLDQSFMYTQILKEMLLTIDFEPQHLNQFNRYCQAQIVGNSTEQANIDQFGRDYGDHLPIWWYTRSGFLYSILNRALRLMEIDLIIILGFFIRDLHENIALVHAQQYDRYDPSTSFIVYRGQGLSQGDFHQLRNTQGGLLSFNSFLSTSIDRDVSYTFANSNTENPTMIGVLFRMSVDPSIHSTPYANITDLSYFQNENEILFTMHSVFRIGEIKPLDESNRLYEVELTLTTDNDPQLHALTERMRQEMAPGSEGRFRLTSLLIKLGKFKLAQQILETMSTQGVDDALKADIHYNSGVVKYELRKYDEAIVDFQNAIKIYQTHPSCSQELATSYSTMGLAYCGKGEQLQALSSHQKALDIRMKTLSPLNPDLAQSYSNIGVVYHELGEYSTALQWHQKGLKIFQTLPPNHPDLATCYNNIGLAHFHMGEYAEALSLYEKALEIRQKVLPSNHPELARSYAFAGNACAHLGQRSRALQLCFKASEILDKSDDQES